MIVLKFLIIFISLQYSLSIVQLHFIIEKEK